MWQEVIIILVTGGFTLLIVKLWCRPKHQTVKNRHVVVVGGSSGIGKSCAVQAARMGANVTLVSRNTNKLESAKADVLKACVSPEEQNIQIFSFDVSNDYEAVEKAVSEIEEIGGPIYMLINCAGLAIFGKLEDAPSRDIKYQMDVNYFGTVYTTKAVISRMKGRQEGKIVIVSSQAGLLGIYGMTCYSATKFALRGFAEALHMEAKPYNITVTLSLPPDTDTPGFAEEEKSKPMETRMISESGGLFTPDTVAAALMRDTLAGKFYSTVGFESFILKTLCAGMCPITSLQEFVIQVSLMGFLRFVSAFYLMQFQRTIKKCMKTRDQTKRAE